MDFSRPSNNTNAAPVVNAFEQFQRLRRGDVSAVNAPPACSNSFVRASDLPMNSPPVTQAATPQGQGSRVDQYRPENIDFGNFLPPSCLLYNRKRYPFDPANVVFADIKARANRGRVVDLGYHLVVPEEKIDTIVQPIELQTPVMRTPFGISSSSFANADVSYALDLGFGDISMDSTLANFFKALAMLDEIVVQKVVANFKDSGLPNPKKWINDAGLHPDMLPHLYKRITAIRRTKSTGMEYPPRLTLKIGNYGGDRLKVTCFDQDMQTVPPNAVVKGTELRAILRVNGLWFQNRSYSVSMYAEQVQIVRHGSGDNQQFGFVIDESSDVAANSSNDSIKFDD